MHIFGENASIRKVYGNTLKQSNSFSINLELKQTTNNNNQQMITVMPFNLVIHPNQMAISIEV